MLEGLKQLSVHTAAALAEALETTSAGLHRVSMGLDTSLVFLSCDTIFCFPVSLQPLTVHPGDGR